jgi:hypothetical protein
MNTKSTLACVAMLALWAVLTSNNPSNPPTGKTGAPGEMTCSTTPGCHSGGNFTGMVTISGVPDTVLPGQAYTITLTHASNAVRAGFQLTVLDGNNAKSGTLTAGPGNNVATGGFRQYVRQSTPKNLVGGTTSWTFTWTAPATSPTPDIHFYFASLAANGNGTNAGDNALTNNKTVTFGTLVGTVEPAALAAVRFFPNPAQDLVRLALPANARAEVRLHDLNGRQVLSTQILADGDGIDVSGLQKGVYIATLRLEGHTVTRELVKE